MYNEMCEVIQNKNLADGVFEMKIRSEKIASHALPGQFIHIKINNGMYPLLRRPISIHCADPANDTVSIVYHTIGKGTTELSHIKEGALLDVMGPLGKGFPIVNNKKCAVVGGGIGVAPLLELVKKLDSCDSYLGFRDCIYKADAFEVHCDKVYIATEDGSTGSKGYITDQLEKNIAEYEVVYTCGPKAMMQRVIDLCKENHIECYVSIEERMGCGIGACLVCACKIKEESGEWHHKKACKDGPVFNGKEVLLDA